MKFKIYNLEKGKISGKSWKTYQGAAKNCLLIEEMVVSNDPAVLDWMNRHPEWRKERLELIKNYVAVH